MEKDISPQYQSFQGLHQVVTTRVKMQSVLSDILNWVHDCCVDGGLPEKYRSIRLLDTFLSDSLDDDVLSKMIGACLRHDLDMKVLVLDPLSPFATTRAEALSINPVEEINKTLFNLRNALAHAQQRRGHNQRELKLNSASHPFLLKQISELESSVAEAELRLSVRFYGLMTEAPTYVISQFVAKGLIVHRKSAAVNPWMILVDDETQQRDLYDFMSENFDAVWDSGEIRPQQPPAGGAGVFLSHGRKAGISLKLRNFIKDKLKLDTVLFEEEKRPGLTIIENLEDLARKCSTAVIIMACEDEQLDGQARARQNVIHELGYCQALYGRDKVVLVAEKGLEIPSNMDGVLRTEFENDAIEACYEFLRDHLVGN